MIDSIPPPTAFVLAVVAGLSACGDATDSPALPHLPEGVQAVSLLGDTLRPAPLPPELQRDREERLAAARAAYEHSPLNADSIIWLGRRLAYLGRYREAIAIYTEGLERHPGDARLYRHRGHRFISVRQFDYAVNDLTHASDVIAGSRDEDEPGETPETADASRSTLHFNIWYHLGLAHYLRGDFATALRSYRACMEVSTNPDALVATSHWLYMTLRRLGDGEEAASVLAPIVRDLDVIDNDSYHRLLLMYRGETTPDELLAAPEDEEVLAGATLGYGIGNWYLYGGQADRGYRVFEEVVRGEQWAAFGFIASEAELARR